MPLSPSELTGRFRDSVLPRRPFHPAYPLALGFAAASALGFVGVYSALIVGTGFLIYWIATLGIPWAAIHVPGLRIKAFALIGVAAASYVIGRFLFMLVRPLFGYRARPVTEFALQPGMEPALEELVRQIAERAGCRRPDAIILNCGVGASAEIAQGGKLILRLGLPLVACCDITSFAAVIAHECGHFNQRWSIGWMSVIRKVNSWFQLVAMQHADWKAANPAGGVVPVVVVNELLGAIFRWVLQVFANGSEASASWVSREMEYHADFLSVALCGSPAAVAMLREVPCIQGAAERAIRGAQVSWNTGRLPENYPALVASEHRNLNSRDRERLVASESAIATRWWDTHPSLRDRCRAINGFGSSGVFECGAPATELFADFDQRAKHLTFLFYDVDLGLNLAGIRLIPTPQAAPVPQSGAHASVKRCRFPLPPVSRPELSLLAFPNRPMAGGGDPASERKTVEELWAAWTRAEVPRQGEAMEEAVAAAESGLQAWTSGEIVRFLECSGIPVDPLACGFEGPQGVSRPEAIWIAWQRNEKQWREVAQAASPTAERLHVLAQLLARPEICPEDSEGLALALRESLGCLQILDQFAKSRDLLAKAVVQQTVASALAPLVFRGAASAPNLRMEASRLSVRLRETREAIEREFASLSMPGGSNRPGLHLGASFAVARLPSDAGNDSAEGRLARGLEELKSVFGCLHDCSSAALARLECFAEALDSIRPQSHQTEMRAA